MERQHSVKGAARPASNYETKAEKGGLLQVPAVPARGEDVPPG